MLNPESLLCGGIELGGTKTLVAVGRVDGTVIDCESIPTRGPALTIQRIAAYFDGRAAQYGPISALGVGAFGPIVLNPSASDYGRLLETNKTGWSGFDLASALEAVCGVPTTFVTDVGAAAIGEARLGALNGVDLGIYLTVGTGIGGAIVCRGMVLPALLHPEMGHIALQKRPDDSGTSTCRFHDNCVEGLAAGPSIIARFGKSLNHFEPFSSEHELIADYLGQLCANLALALSPQRIVIGGGVGKTVGLLAATEQAMLRHLGDYNIAHLNRSNYLSAPYLGQNAGIIGALSSAPTRK